MTDVMEKLNALSAILPDVDDDDARVDEIIDELEELDSLVSEEAQELIRELRPHTVSEDVYEEIEEQDTFSGRMADRFANVAGSWKFIIGFVILMSLWILVNGFAGAAAFDPFPFILLNLALSTLAGLQAPVILMAQNRQAEKDRAMAQNDYQVNLKSEVEIADLHRKVDELTELMLVQSRMLNVLLNARRQDLRLAVKQLGQTRGVGD